jgi:ankyrin repeat protein
MTQDEQSKLNTSLTDAASSGDTATVRMLLTAGAGLHAWDDWALYWAARKGHAETVKVLLSAGADVHAKDDQELRIAALYGETETVRVLARHIFAP